MDIPINIFNMPTSLNPQEIYLLERYISLEYFGEMRDAWGEMIQHLERCLDQFMHNLPLDYRKRPLPEQPDAVWGELVLPNFRRTFQGLCNGYIQISHGDLGGLGHANGPKVDFKGQMEFWSGWMARSDENIYGEFLNLATRNASNICFTEGAYWNSMDLTSDYHEISRGPLNPPPVWPSYRLVPNIKVATGSPLLKTGIYLPDVDNSCAQFLSINYDEAPEASVFIRMEDIFHPVTKLKYSERAIHEKRPCTWTLVERVSDTGGAVTTPTLLAQKTHRVPAGEPCPETGFYFTPAKPDSRRYFNQGDLMTNFDSGYGATIWRWDDQQ
ncbi:hypothetical protein AAKU64_003019 [Undibacterium sp. GrIS 1.8]|uniref:hypothetical protein n=1 Tax=unclassified Undibacterium TaxID=2630295 RepID=UPI003399796E